jgi:hypothetical protein
MSINVGHPFSNSDDRELQEHELDAVSGGSMPLPLLAAVVALKLPSHDPLPPVKGPRDGYITYPDP